MRRKDKLGFQLRKRQIRRLPPITVTCMDVADDIVLVSKVIKNTQQQKLFYRYR